MANELALVPGNKVTVDYGKPSCTLMNWHIDNKRFKTRVLVGEAFGHPMFDDGTLIHTSPIVFLDTKNDICETREMMYKLVIDYAAHFSWEEH